jgi:O-antigen/teichoic acid export membrane protein
MSPSGTSGLRGRTLRGFLLLGVQRVVGLAVTAAGGIVLARLLTPEIFGLYAILAFAVGVGVALSDLGLGAALVQRPDLDPTVTLGTTFTLNLFLASVLALGVVALAPVVARWLGPAGDVAAPLRCLALLIVLASVRMPAAVLLERRLAYLPLAIAETADTVVFYTLAVAAALAGAGLWSFVLGALAARLANVAIVWSAAPARPRPAWRPGELARVLRFGLPFQGNALVTIVRDASMPTIVSAWSGVVAVGFLNWAATLAFQPLQLVTLAGKVLFPALSRVQDDRERFARATERALNRIATVLYPAALLTLAGADPIVRLVYGEAWAPAIPAVQLFCVTTLLGGTSTVLVHALYGLGRADIVFRLHLGWSALLWALTLALVPWLGFVGFAVASALMGATAAVSSLIVRRLAPVRVLAAVRVPLAAGVASALLLAELATAWIHDLPSLVIAGGASALAYVGLLLLLGGAAWRVELMADWRTVLSR